MKKVFMLITVLFMAVGLIACGEEPVPTVIDESPTISGLTPASIKIGETFNPLAGVTASDPEDGNLTSEIAVQGVVDNTTQGTYTLTYVVMDSAKNVTELTRTVTVTIGEAPVISGAGNRSVTFGSVFNPLEGVTASDEEDGNLTPYITVTGTVNLNLIGLYDLTYTVTDSAGNVTTVVRTINVLYGAKTVVTFTSWNLGTPEQNNILRRRIDAFNEMSNFIEIEIMEFTGDYNAFLATMAAAGTFPDVFISGNVPEHILAGYSGEITSVAEADSDWLNVPVALRDAVTYNGRIYAIPAANNFLGNFANLDLIDESGILTDFTVPGYTYAQWIAAVEAATDSTKLDGTSTAGINHPGEFISWLPAVLDDQAPLAQQLGIVHGGVADGQFMYNSSAVKDAIAQAQLVMSNYWGFEAWSDVDPDGAEGPELAPRVARYGSDWWASFNKGQVAFQWDGTWAVQSMATNAANAGFDVHFVGLPGGKVVSAPDYYSISKTTADLEAAYEVAKWLTFGTDGLTEMFNIIETVVPDTAAGEVTLSVSGLPINNTQSIIDKWFVNYPVPGVKEIYEAAAAGQVEVLVEGFKYVPGYVTARWGYNTGIDALISRPNNAPGSTLSIGDLIWDAQFNKINYNEYMTAELQTLINFELLKARLALEEAMNQ